MKLNYVKTLKVGLAFAIIMVFWTAYDYVVPLLLENAYGLSNSMRGLVMGLDNLLSLFLLPLFGKLSDKTSTRWGRRTPYIVIGTLVSVVLMIFVPISANSQLKKGEALRSEIVNTAVKDYSYTDHTGKTYDAESLYRMLYNEGAHNSDYCDRDYFTGTEEEYLRIALNPYTTDEDGKEVMTEDYEKYVKTGINSYASDQVNEKLTKADPTSLIIYMIILFFVLVAMATFRSPAVALMPDVTPKPLRSQANAMINLAGGAGGAVAFLIYTITLLIDPIGFTAIFVAVACSMLIMLALFLWLVKEPKQPGKSPCMVLFCEYEQQFKFIELGRKYGLMHYIPLVFRKDFSAQVLKANMKIVGNCEYGLVLYRDKLPKFNNNGRMIFNCFDWVRDTNAPKIHPTQKPIPLLQRLIEIFTDRGDVVIDPVAGSGSTLFAAASLGRKAYGFEVNKQFYNDANKKMLSRIQLGLFQ